ncbi:MAG: hypothetical protein WCK53_00625 [Methanomicrobiales archaeon]
MIEEKISHLTPDQQREIEDFIDFLIARDSNATQGVHNHESSGNYSGIEDNATQLAPMIFAEDRPVAGHSDQDILPDYPEYGGPETIGKTQEPERRIVIPRRTEREPGKLLDWID